MQTAYDIRVSGKVQGVFYRASTLKKAKEFSVSGWCMNMPNGDVHIFAQGDRLMLNKLLLWCKVGPPKANVDEVDFKEVQMEETSTFEIKDQ